VSRGKKITKNDTTSKKFTQSMPRDGKMTQSGSGKEKSMPQGPPGIPWKLKEQRKSTKALPLGWVDF
jgi:hypothetical protein